MGVDSEESLLPFQRHIKIVEVKMDGAVIYRSEAEIELQLLQNRPPFSGVIYPLCLKLYTGLGLSSGSRQQQQQQLKYTASGS